MKKYTLNMIFHQSIFVMILKTSNPKRSPKAVRNIIKSLDKKTLIKLMFLNPSFPKLTSGVIDGN